MEGTTKTHVPATGAARWTDSETAFVLNFADRCLNPESDYRQSVAEEFFNFAKRQVSLAAISSKVRAVLFSQVNVGWTEFIIRGTQCLDVRKLPRTLVDEMQRQRKDWKLKELPNGDEAQHAATKGAATAFKAVSTSDTSRLKRRASPRDGANPQQSYSEQTTSDSETSRKHSRDDDFNEQPPRKKQKPIPSARSQLSSRLQGTVSPESKVKAQAQKSRKKTATASERPAAAARARSQKRNLDSAEIIDLGSISPPPKRQALENAFERAKGDGTSVSQPGSQGTVGTDDVPGSQHAALLRTQAQSQVHTQIENATLAQTQSKAPAPSFEAATDQPRNSSATQAQKPATGPEQGTTTAGGQKVAQSHSQDTSAIDAVRDLAEIVAVLLREQTEPKFGMNPEVVNRLECIQRTVKGEPGKLLDKMLQDLHSADAAKADMRGLVNDLVGRRDTGKNIFPGKIDPVSIDKGWKAIRTHVKDAFGFEDLGPEPRAEDAGYVAARIDDLANNKRAAGLAATKQFLQELSQRLESPHLAQAVVGALLCGWLFAGPEPMCVDVYSPKELELYRALLLPDKGAVEVQQLDKLGMKLLFENENFMSSILQRRAEQLLSGVEFSVKQTFPDAPGFQQLNSPQRWAETAVKLKQKLMISASEFRIHHCMPGSLFDPAYMQAEDADGFCVPDAKAEGKRIAICLFPALTAHDAPPFGDNPALADVLVNGKTFFPSLVEKLEFDTKKVISKAFVLVV